MQIGPVLSSLRRNHAGAILVALEVAIALAVFVNAAWIVHQRIELVSRPTGIDDAHIFVIGTAPIAESPGREASAAARDHAQVREDLAYLRGLPGVIAASVTDAVPFSQVGFVTDVWTNPTQKGDPVELNALSMDEQGLRALGARLSAGREFQATEILPPLTLSNLMEFVPDIIITRAAAAALFPRQSALGKTIYDSMGKPATVSGIMEDMIGAATNGIETANRVALLPRLPQSDGRAYLVRTVPGRTAPLLAAAEAHLASADPDRVIQYARLLTQFKRRLYLADDNMKDFLLAATTLVLVTTCLGVFGLATFNVNARIRQIGTLRALGARRRDIVWRFMLENGVLTALGIALGCVLAFGAGAWLSRQYGLARLDLAYLAAGTITLWGIGQLSAWYPAHRASAIPPSVATRTL